MDGPPAIDETLAMTNLKIQKAKLGSHTISPNGKTADASLKILQTLEADRTDKIANEKAKEERLAQAHALKLTKMTTIEREEYDRYLAAVVDRKAHDAAAKAKAAEEKAKAKAEAKAAKEAIQRVKNADKAEKAAQNAIKAEQKTAAAALAAAAGQ